MSRYEDELEFNASRLGELDVDECYYLEFNLPEGLSHREADALGHRIMAETAVRHPGAAEPGSGSLSREWLRSSRACLTWEPRTAGD